MSLTLLPPAEMHQIRCRPLGSLQRSPRPPAKFKGADFNGSGSKERGGKRTAGEGRGGRDRAPKLLLNHVVFLKALLAILAVADSFSTIKFTS